MVEGPRGEWKGLGVAAGRGSFVKLLPLLFNLDRLWGLGCSVCPSTEAQCHTGHSW